MPYDHPIPGACIRTTMVGMVGMVDRKWSSGRTIIPSRYARVGDGGRRGKPLSKESSVRSAFMQGQPHVQVR